MRKKGFTLIELLIVISIIAILAAVVVPNFIGFDKDARVSATRANLDTVRGAITLYRAKTGGYPAALADLTTTTYTDAGVTKSYLTVIPAEMVTTTSGSGNSTVTNQLSTAAVPDDGGWLYFTDKAEVHVDEDDALGASWGSYSAEIPYNW